MSDTGRKSLGDKASETVKPDSQKSYVEQTKETLTGAADKVAGAVQGTDNKSTTQVMSDKVGSTKDHVKDSSHK